MVAWLASGLVKRNQFRVVVISPEGGQRLGGVEHRVANDCQQAIAAIPPESNVVHFHGWIPDYIDEHPNWFMTLHGNEPTIDQLPRNCCCISRDHAARHGRSLFVYNGVDPDEYLYESKKHNHLLFFSKVRRRVKGCYEAISLASKHDLKLRIAGGYRFDLLKVGGFINSFASNIAVLGELRGQKKAQEFARASALLFPIAWEEPFGLVMIESLISGTPVLARPRGSVPELIPDDVGGQFATENEFLSELERVQAINPDICREYALDRFTLHQMTENYVDLYQRLMDKEKNIFE